MDQAQTHNYSFTGGITLAAHKDESCAVALGQAKIPKTLVVPVLQHLGHADEAVVEAGNHVDRYQVIAKSDALISVPIHAPTSGVVVAVEDRPVPHPGGLSARCIVIESDGKDTAIDTGDGVEDFRDLDPVDIRRLVREAGIAGLGGATFPTSVKLTTQPGQELQSLILNGAECEPYISCDNMLIKNRAADIVIGAQIMMYALQVNACTIAIEDDRPDTKEILLDAVRLAGDVRIGVSTITAKYPTGGERQLIQALTGKEVSYRGLPADIGYVVHNVGTAAAVKAAVIDAKPLCSRIVTITGTGVAQPCNLEVRFGTLIADVIEQCGGYTESANRLIMGGPMMGFALHTDQVPVVKACNCILVTASEDIRSADIEMPCIRCGDCATACPAQLLPQQLYWHIRAGAMDNAQDYNLLDCIECGCCDYVCPSHIPLAQYFRYGKSEIWHRQEERRRASSARQRYEFREQRLDREQQEHQARLEAKKRLLTTNEKDSVSALEDIIPGTVGKEQIDELMQRVRSKENGKPEDSDD